MNGAEHPAEYSASTTDEQGWQIVDRRRRPKMIERIDSQVSDEHEFEEQTSEKATFDSNDVDLLLDNTSLPPSTKSGPTPIEDVEFCRPHRRDLIFQRALQPLRIETLMHCATKFLSDESDVEDLALVYRKSVIIISFKVAADRIMCDVRSGWRIFEGWLSALQPPPGRHLVAEKGLEVQQQWWNKNGKAFEIMKLPAEIRLNVLEQAVGAQHLPVDRFRYGAFWYCGHGCPAPTYGTNAKSLEYDPTKPKIPKPNWSLPLVSKQIYQEVKPHLWFHATKMFPSPNTLDLHCGLNTQWGPPRFDCLRHLEIDFDHKDYISFFGVKVTPFEPDGWPMAHVLTSLTTLKSFRLHFRSTIGSAEDDPWGYQGRRNNKEWFCDFAGNRDREGFATSCQKVLVDWILTFAKEYIQHFPRIYLTGYIKNSTKAKWDAILKDERDGIHHDMREAKQTIENWPTTDLPPKCYCTKNCRFYDYYTVVRHRECKLPRCPCRPLLPAFAKKLVQRYVFDFED